jgi:fimbrial isopeptide formation D2 family protein/LPXTG-motif cell wall-anchored protein
MKKMKKILALILSAIMILAMAIPSFATETTTNTITLTGNVSGHTYTAYPIFTGSVSSTGVLTTPRWANLNASQVEEFLKDLNKDATLKASFASITLSDITKLEGSDSSEAMVSTAEAVLDIISKASFATDANLDAFSQIAAKHFGASGITGTSGTYNATDKNYTISNLPSGYYVIVDTIGTDAAKGDAESRLILNVTKSESIAVKSSTTTVEKKVADELNGTYGKGISSEIGQSEPVYFELIATLPTLIQNYKSYELLFTDTLSDGLTYDQIEKVYIASAQSPNTSLVDLTVGTDYTVTAPTGNAGGTLQIRVKDLIGSTTANVKDNVVYGKVVVVKYKAHLNSNAVVNSTNGNPNTVVLNYTNDPYATANPDQDPGGTSEESKATVYTYNLQLTKIAKGTANNETPTTLSGAEFILYKVENGVTYYAQIENGKITSWKTLAEMGENKTEADVITLQTGENGIVTFSGLKIGTYYLKEMVAPNGYNKLASAIPFEIQDDSDNMKTVGATKDLSITMSKGIVGTGASSDQMTVSASIENGQGATLPSTGGIGTTIFYLIGGILVVGAAVVLITRRRVNVGK